MGNIGKSTEDKKGLPPLYKPNSNQSKPPSKPLDGCIKTATSGILPQYIVPKHPVHSEVHNGLSNRIFEQRKSLIKVALGIILVIAIVYLSNGKGLARNYYSSEM